LTASQDAESIRISCRIERQASEAGRHGASLEGEDQSGVFHLRRKSSRECTRGPPKTIQQAIGKRKHGHQQGPLRPPIGHMQAASRFEHPGNLHERAGPTQWIEVMEEQGREDHIECRIGVGQAPRESLVEMDLKARAALLSPGTPEHVGVGIQADDLGQW